MGAVTFISIADLVSTEECKLNSFISSIKGQIHLSAELLRKET